MNIKHRQSCRICGNFKLKEVVNLGDQFLQGCFVKDGVQPSRRKVPNLLVRCDVSQDEGACGLVQTAHTIPPYIMYSNYWYKSGISDTMTRHLQSITQLAMEKVGVNKKTRVLDIACNDGTLLNFYPNRLKRVGIDPSDITNKIAPQENQTIINDFFPSSRLEGSQFDIITSIAVFYDLESPESFVRKIEELLSPNGIWCVEVAYLPFILENLCYDTIVSEHLEHYHLAPLEYLFDMCGLKLVDVYLNDTNGGSVQCWVAKKCCAKFDNAEAQKRMFDLRLKEFDTALDSEKPYEIFRQQIFAQKYQLVRLLKEIRAKGQTIHLYGASTKANTLLGFCEIDKDIIQFASERSPEKWGAETISGIKIISEADSRAMRPDYYLVGPWHFKQEILAREKQIMAQGTKFIFPLPKVEVYG